MIRSKDHAIDLIANYQPKTELGKKLLECRRKYIAAGGRLFTVDEINTELERENETADTGG